MTGPDQGASAGRGHMRAAQADREQAITVLKAAYAQGRLTKDELEVRAGQAFASRTYAELAALTADIPADSLAAGSDAAGSDAAGSDAAGPPPSTPARTMAKAACRSGVCLLAAVALAEGAFLAGNFLLIVAAAFALIAMSGFLGYGILDAWQQRRSRGQLPPGPSQGHPPSEGRRRGDGVTPGGISPVRADRTRTDRNRADSRAWRPRRDPGHPSRRRIPLPIRPLPNAACDAGCLSRYLGLLFRQMHDRRSSAARSYDVDAAFMSLRQHEGGIHAVWFGADGTNVAGVRLVVRR